MDQQKLNRLSELTSALSSDTSGGNAAARLLIWGGSGVGKSHTSMQVLDAIVPADKAIVWVDTSDNFLIAPQIGIRHPWQRIPFTFIEDLRIMAEAMKEGIEPWNYVGGILLDEASMMAQADVDRLFEARVANWNPNEHKGDPAPLAPDFMDSRPGLVRFRNMINAFWEVPGLHVIMTAHERTPDPQKRETQFRADFPPATYKVAKAKVRLVARMEADAVSAGKGADSIKRTLQVLPTNNSDAKNSLGIQDIRFDAEHLPGLVKNWLGTPEASAPVISEPDVSNDDTSDDEDNFSIEAIN